MIFIDEEEKKRIASRVCLDAEFMREEG